MTAEPTSFDKSFEEDFWLPYDKKVGKDKCITKWALLSPTEHLKIKVHVPGFVSRKRNKQYRPNPLSYLNGKMWLDESLGQNGEQDLVYKTPEQPTFSDYEAKPYDPQKGKDFIVGKIKLAYETGVLLNDAGSVYTNRLRPFLNTPEDILQKINQEVTEMVNEKPTNRFEEKKEYNYDTEVRSRIIKFNLDQFREQGIKIYEKL